MNRVMHNIYGDERDLLIIREITDVFKTFRNLYATKRNVVTFLLYNDLRSIVNFGDDELIYLKVCHTILGKETNVYEFFFIGNQSTVEIPLPNISILEREELLLIYYTNDKKRHFVNLTKSFRNSKRNLSKQVHFHFNKGRVDEIVPYVLRNKLLEKWMVIIFILIALIIFAAKCW